MEVEPEIDEKQSKLSWFWWVRQFILILVGGFYLFFGIQLLVSAYQLDNPFTFILTFFASNFIILFSAALLVGFIWRVVVKFRHSERRDS
jgi:hypothetical protein